MDPNQQPNQPSAPNPQPVAPQPPSAYPSPVSQNYDPNYLDSIAPPPPRAKFISGTFGKVFYILIGLFVLAISLIIAFSGKDETADLQQIAVRLDNFTQTAKTVQKSIVSKNLKNINSTYIIWLSGNQSTAEDLLKKGGVSKTEYSRDMKRKEETIAKDLDAKFETARLAAKLNRVYAQTMAAEADKLLNMLSTMSKKNKSKQIRDFATTSATTLTQIQKDFNDFSDDGN
jgi:hypothetical protein